MMDAFLPLQEWATLAAGVLVGVALLYLLRPRRRRIDVPFGGLWQEVLAQADARSLGRRWRRVLSWLLMSALAALMWWRPPAPARPWGHAGRRALACAVVGVLVAIPGAWLMAGRASHRGQGAARSRIGAVLPAWVGSAFPLVEHTDIAGRLSAGRWIVLLYHHRCPRCRRALPRYEQLAGANAADPEAAGVALIQLPPFEPEPTGSAAGSGQAVRGRLADDRAWTFPTPLEVRIDNGVVTAVERPLDLPAAP